MRNFMDIDMTCRRYLEWRQLLEKDVKKFHCSVFKFVHPGYVALFVVYLFDTDEGAPPSLQLTFPIRASIYFWRPVATGSLGNRGLAISQSTFPLSTLNSWDQHRKPASRSSQLCSRSRYSSITPATYCGACFKHFSGISHTALKSFCCCRILCRSSAQPEFLAPVYYFRPRPFIVKSPPRICSG